MAGGKGGQDPKGVKGAGDKKKADNEPKPAVSPSTNIEKPTVEPPNAKPAKELTREPPKWLYVCEVLVAVVVAIFTGVQVWYGRLQWNTANAQADIMREQIKQTDRAIKVTEEANVIARKSLLAQQRPWVSINANVLKDLTPGEPLNPQLEMKNTGQTPATVIGGRAELLVLQPNVALDSVGMLVVLGHDRNLTLEQAFLDQFIEAARKTIHDLVIPPNADVPYGIPGLVALEQKDIDEITRANLIPVVVATVIYLDSTKEEHTTRFCAVYNPKSREFTRTPLYNGMD